MNTDRDKYLTEAMGGKVRNVTSEKREFRGNGYSMFSDFICSCCDGPQSACNNYATDFSTWDGFGKLWEWSRQQDWWSDFSAEVMCTLHFIHPDRFAGAVYGFLKGREA